MRWSLNLGQNWHDLGAIPLVSKSLLAVGRLLWQIRTAKDQDIDDNIVLKLMEGQKEPLQTLSPEFQVMLELGAEVFQSLWEEMPQEQNVSGTGWQFGHCVYENALLIAPYTGSDKRGRYTMLLRTEYLPRLKTLGLIQQSAMVQKKIDEIIDGIRRFCNS